MTESGNILSVEEFNKIITIIKKFEKTEHSSDDMVSHYPVKTCFGEDAEEYCIQGTYTVYFHVLPQLFFNGQSVPVGKYVQLVPTNRNENISVEQLKNDIAEAICTDLFNWQAFNVYSDKTDTIIESTSAYVALIKYAESHGLYVEGIKEFNNGCQALIGENRTHWNNYYATPAHEA